MKTPSLIFLSTPRCTRGRRSTRWLDDSAVARAKSKSKDTEHQMKILSRAQKVGVAMREMIQKREANV